MMSWEAYLKYFQEITEAANPPAPYDTELYLDYTKMNWSRTGRWLKHSPLTPETKKFLNAIQSPQQWIVITEPWCGDAAHIVPVLYLMSLENSSFTFNIQLRDAGSEIAQYLTNGTKSIPILIVRDEKGKDIFHWGPRPEAGTGLFKKLTAENASFDELKIALQNFYNKDKAAGIQEEIIQLQQAHGR